MSHPYTTATLDKYGVRSVMHRYVPGEDLPRGGDLEPRPNADPHGTSQTTHEPQKLRDSAADKSAVSRDRA
jgi:hypothetical protein